MFEKERESGNVLFRLRLIAIVYLFCSVNYFGDGLKGKFTECAVRDFSTDSSLTLNLIKSN